MATFKKLATGKWQAQVARQGVRKARSFSTKQESRDWAARQEYLISLGEGTASCCELRDVFMRYSIEVSPTKRGARWEQIRLQRFCKDRLADILLKDLKAADFADWRDRRLLQVAPGSVKREMVLMSGVITMARREWSLIDKSPMSDVRKPSSPPPRDRRVSKAEIEQLVSAAGGDLEKMSARAIHAFRFAVETAMRAGEIVGLEWRYTDIKKRVAHLPRSKNGTSRDVPLSSSAIGLLEELPETDGPCFGLSSGQLDALFRKVRDKAGIENLHFHDSRHEAITRLAHKLDVLSLARMVGHKDIRMLQVYYNETAEELALRLD